MHINCKKRKMKSKQAKGAVSNSNADELQLMSQSQLHTETNEHSLKKIQIQVNLEEMEKKESRSIYPRGYLDMCFAVRMHYTRRFAAGALPRDTQDELTAGANGRTSSGWMEELLHLVIRFAYTLSVIQILMLQGRVQQEEEEQDALQEAEAQVEVYATCYYSSGDDH